MVTFALFNPKGHQVPAVLCMGASQGHESVDPRTLGGFPVRPLRLLAPGLVAQGPDILFDTLASFACLWQLPISCVHAQSTTLSCYLILASFKK